MLSRKKTPWTVPLTLTWRRIVALVIRRVLPDGSRAMRLRVSSRDGLPVNDVPPRLQVVRAAVLVLEVVGVLPHVVAEQRRRADQQWRVLIRGRAQLEVAIAQDEPRPAGPELSDAVRLEALAERVNRSEAAHERVGEF